LPNRDTAELSTFSASDGYRFYYRHYRAAGEPRARLVLLHGIRSHGSWYARSCEEFARAGFEVYFLERRGAGLNTAHRGDAPNFRRLIDDVAEFTQHLRSAHARLPVFLFGISWGGKLAAALPYRKPNLLDGIALLCPGLAPKVSVPFPQRARIALSRALRPWRMFRIPLNEPELFTASRQWRDYIANDPHGLREATSRFLFNSFRLDLYLRRAVTGVNVPAFLALAEHDRIIDNAHTSAIVSRFRGTTEIKTYAGAHHTLEFESPDHPWFADVVSWLERQIAR
jgi:alpha-beta hydrolase superfamily lysophospholipase